MCGGETCGGGANRSTTRESRWRWRWDAHGDPRRAAELRQLYARLITALDALAAPLRSTVVLVALHGMNHEQAARILACSTGTVAWRMHRARRQLAAALRPPSRRGGPQEDDSGIFLLFPALGRQ